MSFRLLLIALAGSAVLNVFVVAIQFARVAKLAEEHGIAAVTIGLAEFVLRVVIVAGIIVGVTLFRR